jgi:signal recognition particle subunit SRP54
MRAVTGKPIKLMGTGEKIDAIEDFDPSRIAGRILGMGDVVGLVEKAIETVEIGKAEKIAAKMRKGAFDLDDLAEQLKQMQKLGGMGGVLGMLPGVGKIKKQLDTAKLDDAILKRQQAIIGSMTKGERKNPKLLNASRKKRVAAGSGTSVQDINKLVKMHRQMADMMKAMGKKRGMLGQMFGGGPPPELPADLPSGAALPPGLPPLPPGGLPGLGGGLPRGLPGLPGMPRGFPGLPGSKKR